MSLLLSSSNFLKTVLECGLFSPPGGRASPRIPAGIEGRYPNLLADDYNYVLARWFLNALTPLTPEERTLTFLDVYPSVKEALQLRFPNSSESELQEATGLLSRFVCDIRDEKREARQTFPLSTRHEVLRRSNNRCSICGYKFTDDAIELFITGRRSKYKKYSFYDFLKQTQKNLSNSAIHVDHMRPLAFGGTNEKGNLQVLCGFCNMAKRDRLTIFDSGHGPRSIEHPELGLIRISSNFLIVRMLSQNSCHKCSAKSSEKELTVSPINPTWEINPVNALVTCYEHDLISKYRYIPNKE